MNTATRTRLRITGFALVVAALISNWVFDRKAQPPVPTAKPAATSTATPPQVARAPVGAPASEPVAPGAPLACVRPPNVLPGMAPIPPASNCDAGSQ